MANFNININAQPVIPYTITTQGTKIQRSNCTVPLTEDIPIGLVSNTNTPGVNFLLGDYSGIGYSTLRVYNVEYRDDTEFYLEYAGSKIIPNVDPNVAVATIDISTVLINEAIPTFNIVIDASPLDAQQAISFEVEIEDTATDLGGKVFKGYSLLPIECAPVAVKDKVVTDSSTNTSCYTEAVATVKVPTGSSRYIYGVITDGFGTIAGGTLPETITADKTYTLKIDADNSGSNNGIYSRVSLNVKDNVSDGTVNASKVITRNHSGNIC